jgi:sugar phosphate isomerase/epimerase
MWDFSWLERRWPGAGYEDWDKVLDELLERGYNAIRIDAYPHLIAEDPTKKWMLNEVWNQQVWGSPDLNEVQVQPNLNKFLEKCKERDIKVGLSSWYRQDVDDIRMKITTADKMADCWISTLRTIETDGLLDTVLYVDLCNEWPGNLWAPFFSSRYPHVVWGQWHKEESLQWMKHALTRMRKEYPDMPFLFSFDNGDVLKYEEIDTSFLDLYEHHIWMVHQNNSEFYKLVDYKDGQYSPEAYKKVVKVAEKLYKEKPSYWQKLLTDKIELTGKIAKRTGRPLITTECWGIVDYKDWPLLNWDWVKELCALGTVTAAQTGMWAGIATSNFCGPQFVGMWRDVKWHQNLTTIIKSAILDESIIMNNEVAAKLLRRL